MICLRRGLLFLIGLGLLLSATAGAAPSRPAHGPDVEVVVTLAQPPLASAARFDRTLATATRRGHRVDLRAPASVSYLRRLAAAQRTLQARITAAVPDARYRWSYKVVLNGFSVVLPKDEAARLRSVPGVTQVYPSVSYHALLDRSPQLIGAPTVWGPTLATAGQGMKIGIIDDGVDRTHPFFNPSGFTMPAGFPKGNKAYTTAKVIVARAFAPAHSTYKYASLPFDPKQSEHATHVAGIAAGDHGTVASTAPGSPTVSGVAPRAYLGNYKVLGTPTPGFGLNGNSPEIAKGIDAAVADGMDVINLSLGEPEIELSRDLVVKAIDGAADAGVVSAIAAGNSFDEVGRGSVGSPGSAPKAITAAAVTGGRDGPSDVIADFSSAGPTPLSRQLKPDVSAPGVGILSSVPARLGFWQVFNGTSMASPHIAGAAAVLRQRHPLWTVAQVKSALEQTGRPVYADGGHTREVPTTREGGGLIDLPKADTPRLFADPTAVSFDLGGETFIQAPTVRVTLTDAGGGAGDWSVSVVSQGGTAAVAAPAAVTVPGTLDVQFTNTSLQGTNTGFVILRRGADVRRIPYFAEREIAQLPHAPHRTLARAGVFAGSIPAGTSFVSTYRYPDDPRSFRVPAFLPGPELAFRYVLKQPAANLGAVLLKGGTAISPRLVMRDDENRLAGDTSLPFFNNPYLSDFGASVPAVAATRPAPGEFEVVLDTETGGKATAYRFRFWVNDTTPPAIRLLTPKVRRGGILRIAVTDGGSGVDPNLLTFQIDGRNVHPAFGSGRATLRLTNLGRGRHTLLVRASDWQETKNNENSGGILPNTRTVRTTFVVR
jgi:subtilisin family serine protease